MISYHQVNKILSRRNVFTQLCRHTHEQSRARLYPLKNRKLIKIQGNDASIFLQGLITNDMRHFDEGSKSIYAMFLNNKGRVLYDTLIHKIDNCDSFMIECDKNILINLQKHLMMFKLKRKVHIEDSSENYKLWALVSDENAIEKNVRQDDGFYVYKDPRLSDLGFRIITSSPVNGSQLTTRIEKKIILENDDGGYHYLRYKLGVSEGASDLPPGTCFPLEVNCDYLHGVSFHKGCYIGQELTARVHHTGVIRKRIMPLKFSESSVDDLEKDSVISSSNNTKSNFGKLKGFTKDYGIGLVRVKEVLEAKVVQIGKYTAEVIKPKWWPIEAPKEKATKIEQE